jgi:hypothetical protein
LYIYIYTRRPVDIASGNQNWLDLLHFVIRFLVTFPVIGIFAARASQSGRDRLSNSVGEPGPRNHFKSVVFKIFLHDWDWQIMNGDKHHCLSLKCWDALPSHWKGLGFTMVQDPKRSYADVAGTKMDRSDRIDDGTMALYFGQLPLLPVSWLDQNMHR